MPSPDFPRPPLHCVPSAGSVPRSQSKETLLPWSRKQGLFSVANGNAGALLLGGLDGVGRLLRGDFVTARGGEVVPYQRVGEDPEELLAVEDAIAIGIGHGRLGTVDRDLV